MLARDPGGLLPDVRHGNTLVVALTNEPTGTKSPWKALWSLYCLGALFSVSSETGIVGIVVAMRGDQYRVGHPESQKSSWRHKCRANLGPLAGGVKNRKYFLSFLPFSEVQILRPNIYWTPFINLNRLILLLFLFSRWGNQSSERLITAKKWYTV